MITRFEQIVGSLTLIGIGAGIILSHLVMASTTYFIEVNFGLSQYLFGSLFFAASVPIIWRRISRATYTLCLVPYGIYWIGNMRYVYVTGLASVVPYIVTMLLVALNWFVIVDFARAVVRIWSTSHGTHTTNAAG